MAALRFLADESCDFAVVRALRGAGYDVVAVAEFTNQSLICITNREMSTATILHKRALPLTIPRWVWSLTSAAITGFPRALALMRMAVTGEPSRFRHHKCCLLTRELTD